MANDFKLREGVIPVQVCGETILVAGREVRGECPYTLHLGEVSAYCFSLMTKGLGTAEMAENVSAHYGMDTESAEAKVTEFINMLNTYDYFAPEDGE